MLHCMDSSNFLLTEFRTVEVEQTESDLSLFIGLFWMTSIQVDDDCLKLAFVEFLASDDATDDWLCWLSDSLDLFRFIPEAPEPLGFCEKTAVISK